MKLSKTTAIVIYALIVLLVLYAVGQAQNGDVNKSGRVDVVDVVDLVRYIFEGEPLPNNQWSEVDTTAVAVRIGGVVFGVNDWPVRVMTNFYEYQCSSGVVCTTTTQSVVIDEPFFEVMR